MCVFFGRSGSKILFFWGGGQKHPRLEENEDSRQLWSPLGLYFFVAIAAKRPKKRRTSFYADISKRLRSKVGKVQKVLPGHFSTFLPLKAVYMCGALPTLEVKDFLLPTPKNLQNRFKKSEKKTSPHLKIEKNHIQ